MNDKAYWIWLQQALGYAVKVDEIVSTFGHAKKVYEASHEERARSGAFTPRQLTKIRNTPLSVVDDIIQGCRECKCRVLTPDDERYPKKLFDLQDYPLVLYYLGDPDVLKNRMTIALVGTRKASQTGLKVAYRLSSSLAKSDVCVVSGGALGIDGASHLGALSEDGITCAVLGCGFLAKYKDSVANLKTDIAEKGLVLTEFAPRTPPIGRNFPVRNRIISALSYGVVVVEGSLKSGSLITARMAIEQGRELFAVPGDAINSLHSGTIELIRNGATPVFSCRDVLSVFEFIYPDLVDYENINDTPLYENRKPVDFSKVTYGVTAVYTKDNIPEEVMEKVINDRKDEEEKQTEKAKILKGNDKDVYEVLTFEPMHIDDIMRALPHLTPGKIMVSLTHLEMDEMVLSDNGKKYRRK
ncbi:MAG: DNA-processing protein DprA [Clostridia bacterium]|nr:DNA-processing protein DprA [Clostridia bacterium]